MFTLILAWINSVYDSNYELLFLGTILIDMLLIIGIVKQEEYIFTLLIVYIGVRTDSRLDNATLVAGVIDVIILLNLFKPFDSC